MVDVSESEGLGTFEDPMGIVTALCNSSLDGCKEGFPTWRLSNDDDGDRVMSVQRVVKQVTMLGS